MKFAVMIEDAAGKRRIEEFASSYDATTVLEEQVKTTLLRPGESIVMTNPPRDRQDRRKEQVPAIERVA